MRADSDDTRRELQLEMSPQATHIVAWLPLTLPLPVLEQDGQGLGPGAAALGEERREKRAPLQGSLGQGQGDKARGQSADLASSSAPVNGPSARCHALGQALSALRPSLAGTPGPCRPHYGQRYQQAQAIATSWVEATVHAVVRQRCCKHPQRQGATPGAHVVLPRRGQTRDGALRALFKRWWPAIDIEVEELPVAA